LPPFSASAGSLISLALSKWTAKRMMGVRVIESPQSELERWLVGAVKRLAEQAHIGMPEVGIFDAEEMNASPPAHAATRRSLR